MGHGVWYVIRVHSAQSRDSYTNTTQVHSLVRLGYSSEYKVDG